MKVRLTVEYDTDDESTVEEVRRDWFNGSIDLYDVANTGGKVDIVEVNAKQPPLTPKELAKLMDKAAEIHEASWNATSQMHYGRYTKDWYEATREAGMPEIWLGLVAPYMSLGYADTWDWTKEAQE